jgi:hypothetical protein
LFCCFWERVGAITKFRHKLKFPHFLSFFFVFCCVGIGGFHCQFLAKAEPKLPFLILLQYDASIAFLLGFGMAMHYPSKFETICYGAQCIFGIIYKGHCRCICVVLNMSNTPPIV